MPINKVPHCSTFFFLPCMLTSFCSLPSWAQNHHLEMDSCDRWVLYCRHAPQLSPAPVDFPQTAQPWPRRRPPGTRMHPSDRCTDVHTWPRTRWDPGLHPFSLPERRSCSPRDGARQPTIICSLRAKYVPWAELCPPNSRGSPCPDGMVCGGRTLGGD